MGGEKKSRQKGQSPHSVSLEEEKDGAVEKEMPWGKWLVENERNN